MTYLLRLEGIGIEDIGRCGGKAARLGEAMRLGCPVPPGVVLTTDLYRRFMQQGGLQGEVVSILTAMQPTTMHQFQAAEWAIQSAFKVRRVPADVREAIAAALDVLGGLPVAVRSSATSEDSPQLSFVGQHGTYLYVNTLDAATAAVVGCWMSLYSAKALYYAHRFGVDLLRSAMAVLIQGLVRSAAEGALYTVDPITGNPDVFVLEVHQGRRQGVHRLDPYARHDGETPLFGELRQIGLRLDEHLDAYQTLEWLVEGERVQLVRVRPVTCVPPFLPVAVRAGGTGSRGPLHLVSPPGVPQRALAPYSWYHRSRSRATRAAHFARVIREFSSYAGRDDYYLRGYLYTRWRQFAFAATSEGPPPRRFMADVMRVLAARRLDHEFRALRRARRGRLTELAQTDVTALRDDRLVKYLAELQGINEAFLEQAGRLGDSPAVLARLARQLHQDWLGADVDLETLLYTGQDQKAQAERALCDGFRAAEEPADRERVFEVYWATHRHLYLGLNPVLDAPDICSLRENREEALRVMQHCLADDDHNPIVRHRRLLEARRELEGQALSRLSWLLRPVYRYVLHLARRYQPLVFDAYEPLMLGFLLERDVVLEVGRRLVDLGLADYPEDGRFLGDQEIVEFLSGEVDRPAYADMVRERRELARRWQRYSPPRVLGAETPTIDRALQELRPVGAVLRGRPVSRGLATGRVRVVHSLGEAANVLPGEVLVCPEALFELSPLFGIASAVVSETGGLLDNAATLVREYGIPAVFGVEGATRRLRDGQQVLVDASEGTVQPVLSEPEWVGL